MSYYGSWDIDDLLTFCVNTHNASTGAATDADSVPTYRVYEDETGTAILNGSMAKLDDTNTTGFYSEQITLSAANGFEKGKSYSIYISATVSSTVGTTHHSFQIAAEINVAYVSDDSTAADNLELQYDGTGITGDNYPSTQSQLGSVVATGAAVNTPAESYVLTTGTQSSGTVTSTQALDGTNHEHTDTAGAMDLYYQFDVGGDGVPTSVTMTGYLTGINDNLEVYAYNWAGTSWDRIGTLDGVVSATNSVHTYTLFTSHVGTGVNQGKVRIRYTDGAFTLTTATLAVDQIYTSYSIATRSVGYAEGAIWIDTNGSNTNTESYVDGVADNPVSTWAAALTIAGNLGLKRFRIAASSTITLTSDSSNYELVGEGLWNLAMGGQTVTGIYVKNASVSGTGNGTGAIMEDCSFQNSVSIPSGYYVRCGIASASGTPLTGSTAGEYAFVDCVSTIPGSATPNMDFSGLGSSSGVNFRRWSGGSNMTLDANNTLSLEVVGGGGQTVVTGGAGVEIRGTCRAVSVTVSASETVQFVGVTGPITITDAASVAPTINLYGVAASVTDGTSSANDYTVKGPSLEAVLVDTGTTIPADIASLNDLSAAQVNAEVVDVLTVDTYASDLSAPPASNSTILDKLSWILMAFRNRRNATATQEQIYKDDATTVAGTSVISDDGTTTERGEYS